MTENAQTNYTPFKRYRLRSGISVPGLAGMTGISKTAIYCYDAGKYKPGEEHADTLAKALHTDVKELFPGGLSGSKGRNWRRGVHKLSMIIQGSQPPAYDVLELILARVEVYNMHAEGADPAEAAESSDAQELFYEALKHLPKNERGAIYLRHSDHPLDCDKINMTEQEIVAVARKGLRNLRKYEAQGLRRLQRSRFAEEFASIVNE
jgi:transcriptional regulator with XRE-family HTH domain